jgi:hypothetical protein
MGLSSFDFPYYASFMRATCVRYLFLFILLNTPPLMIAINDYFNLNHTPLKKAIRLILLQTCFLSVKSNTLALLKTA